MRQDDKTINNLTELVKALLEDTKDLKPVWYRGQYDKDWKLVPLAFRAKCDTEMNLIRKFKQDATLFLNPRPAKQIEWLFIMRHYGVATRLLDWTESPLVGAYFTVAEKEDKDGALWALLPLEMNKQGNRTLPNPENLPSFEEDEFMQTYNPESYYQERASELLPIAFIAPRNTSRMQSQLSTFTISHRNEAPIENIGDGKHVWKYIIPATAKTNILNELEQLGIGRFQLFPELESIGQKLKGGQ